jgi:drug/metabolite transporter (DMT)-like permease
MTSFILLTLVALIWGSTFVVVKDSLSSFGPFALLTLRFALATLVLFIFVRMKHLDAAKYLRFGIITGILQFLTYASQTVGLLYTTPSNSAFITVLFVVFVPIMNYLFFQKHPNVKDIIACVIAVIGVWFVTGGIQQINIGDMVTFITTITFALYVVVSAFALKKGSNPLVLTYQQLFVTAVMSLFMALINRENFISSNSHIYLSITYLALFATCLAYFIQNTALKKLNIILVTIILSLEPFFALLFSCGFGFEPFSIMKLLGGLLILFAITIPEMKLNFLKK